MATKDCTFFVDIDGRQVEMDFDGFRAYLMQDGVMATLAPDLTKKRGKKAGFTITAQKAEATPAKAEAAPVRAEAPKARAEATTPSEMEVSSENLRKLMPKLSKARADAIIAVMKAMGIPFDRLKIAKGKLEGKETLQQADIKARDAEYMAAVKAGDTAKAQRMVDEAAKAAGYTEKAYHATNRQFSIFNADAGRYTYPVTSAKAIYFTNSKEEASFWADVKSQSSGQPIVLPVYLRPSISSRYPKPVQRVDAGGVPADQLRVSRTNADMIILENVKEFGGDALVTDYVVFSPSQIKSADPITYDDKGNVIPLSERFRPETPDIRYQGEAAPLGSITFIDDLNALISVFEKANFSTVIHEAMHFYRRHMLNTAQGFTAEEIKRFEDWAGAKNGQWSVEAEEKAARAFEKYLRDGLAPLPELRDLFRKVARWMREVYATLTGSPVDIDIPADIRQIFDRIFTLEAERQKRGVGKEATPTAGARSLQQIDIKARDAEYMAAVKAGDTAKAQRMVDEAAKAAGYTTGPVYHGTKQRFSVFKSERDRTGLIYFSENEKFAEQYARGTGKKRAASPEVQVRITSARRQADELVSQLLTDAEKRFGGFSQIPLSVQEDAIAKGRDLERGLLDGMTASEAEMQMGVRVVEAYLKASSIFDPRQHWREYLPVIARSVNKSPTNLDAQFLAHVKAGHYLVWEHPDVIDAIWRDYDAVRLQETEGETASTLAVRGPSQIKFADPITYDDKGNVIPLSERFKPSTSDIRYQREGEGVPQAETATAAYRRAMRERQQEKAAEALRRLGREGSKPASLAPAQPRPSLEITPVNRRAVIEAMQELRDFRKDLEKRGVDIADASEADLKKWEKLLNRVEQLGGVNPITPQMDAEFAKAVRSKTDSPEAIQLLEKAAKKAFGISNFVAGGTHTRTVTIPLVLDEKQQILKVLNGQMTPRQLALDIQRVLLDRRINVTAAWARSKDWRQTLKDYLTGKDERFSGSQKRELGQYVQAVVTEIRKFTQDAPVQATDVFQTGKPVLASVYRGGELEGGEFREEFLGAYTKAPSAKMGYFFAGRSETSGHYSRNVQRYVVAMYNPLVFDFAGDRKRVARLSQVIRDAYANGHDGVIAVNIYDPSPIDNVFIIPPGGENRIKAYEITSRADERIPLSERFNPTTRNVLYQGEDPLPNVEGTSTEAFRRKQAEQRQKNLVDAMNRLRQGKGQTPPKTEGQAAQAATPPPTAQAAPKTAPPSKTTKETRQRKASIKAGVRNATQARRRGFGGKSLDEIFNAFVQRAKAGGLTPTETATEPEKLEERIQRGLRDVIRAAYELNLQDTAIADQAKRAAGEALAAQRIGDTAAQEKALQEFADIVAKSRELIRGPKSARPQKTVAQQYDDMLKRAQKPGKPYQDATPEERADMYIKRQIRKLQDLLKMAQQKGINVDTMEVNGKTVSRKDHFTQAAEDYRKAFLNQDHVAMSAATDRMRDATDSIVSQLPELKAMPLWYNSRSPLSYANVVGSYEGMMGELGRQISEAFMRVHSDIARNLVSFTEGLKRLQEQMNRVYKPLMMDEGYYGMPRVIDDHITYLRNYMAYSSALQRVLAEQAEKNIKFLKNPMDWYVLRRDFARQRIGDQYGAFPLASAMLKSFVYTTKLKYNVKSAMTQYASLIMSVGPYMSPDQLAKIIAEAAKPSTGNRKVDGDLTLRQVAIGESGGRQAEGAPAEASSVWWHRGDVFQFTSEQVRIAGYLVGEEMVRREQEYLREKGLPLLDEATQKRRIRDWVEKVEFDNSPWNMAPMFRGPVKGVLFQFKPFLQKNVERFIADMIRNPIGYQRGKARTPVGRLVEKLPDNVVRRAAAFGYQIGFGGISSALTLIPGLKNVAAPLILGGLTSALVAMGMDDDDAEELAIAINYGFPAAIGMDLSSSMGFLDEIPGKTLAEQIVNFGLGPTVSTLAEVGKRTGELVETVQKPAKLGREDEKQAEIMRRAINIPKAITPYTRMFETALDWVQGKPSTIYLDKEMQLTPYEKVIRMLGGTPIRQTMFFDEKESYGWQKSLMGKPTGFERLKKKEGESDANYFQRKSRADTLERIYLPRLQNYSGFKALSKEDQAIVLDNLWRNIVEESETPKPPDRSKFTPATLVQTRRANIRGKAREERRKAREQMYYGGRPTPQGE